VAEVLKSLTILNEAKPLSYRERKMLDRARFLLVSELSEAAGMKGEEMEETLDEAMAECLKEIKKLAH
jgi:CarD family transcriptional regulator